MDLLYGRLSLVIKVLANKLAPCGLPVSDDHLLIYNLDGLSLSYCSFCSSIQVCAHTCPLSLNEFHTLLICKEISLIKEASMQSINIFISLKLGITFNPSHGFAHRDNYWHHMPQSSFN